jgi:lipid-A-disaccharide synthase
LLETACLMNEKRPEIQFVIALAETRKTAEVEAAKREIKNKNLKLPARLIIVKNDTYNALKAADAAAVASGTATLEAAIIGTPFAIVYNTSPFNWYALRPLISVEHYGLVNLIAQKRLVKELIQHDFTARNLSAELYRLLESEENKKMRKNLREVAETLGRGGASVRAAKAILQILEK